MPSSFPYGLIDARHPHLLLDEVVEMCKRGSHRAILSHGAYPPEGPKRARLVGAEGLGSRIGRGKVSESAGVVVLDDDGHSQFGAPMFGRRSRT